MTLREMDPFVRFRIGGLVVSRSVKYLGKTFLRLRGVVVVCKCVVCWLSRCFSSSGALFFASPTTVS